MLEVHAILQRQRCNENITKKTGTLSDAYEFDLIISFTNAYAGEDWTAETVTLKGCLFNEDGMESKQDDTNITKEFNLNPFDIITGEGTSSWL